MNISNPVAAIESLLNESRSVLILTPALSLGYLHFQTGTISLKVAKIGIIASVIVASLSSSVKLVDKKYKPWDSKRYVWKFMKVVTAIIPTIVLQGYAIWSLFQFAGESMLYMIVLSAQIMVIFVFFGAAFLILTTETLAFVIRTVQFVGWLSLKLLDEFRTRLSYKLSEQFGTKSSVSESN